MPACCPLPSVVHAHVCQTGHSRCATCTTLLCQPQVPTKVARGINQVPTKLAYGVKALADGDDNKELKVWGRGRF